MKMLTAYTYEVDDPQLAVEEIMEQLNLEENALKNSVGIINCHVDFIKEGVAKAVGQSLPFDSIGMTTQSSATPGSDYDPVILTVAVLTGDDVEFVAGMSPSLHDPAPTLLEDIYTNFTAPLTKKPSMFFVYAPVMVSVVGEDLLAYMDSLSGSLPIFGSVAIDFTDQMREPLVLFNGESYDDRLVVILLAGSPNLRFSAIAVSEDRFLEQKAIITKCEGNVIQEINEVSAVKYLESIGLARDGRIDGSFSIPFAIDAHDGKPLAVRNIFEVTPEGYIECGGNVTQNATLSIGSMDVDEIIKTANQMVQEVKDSGKQGGVFFISCATRSFTLGFNADVEIAAIQERMKDSIPFLFSYSGGEMCPIPDNSGKLVSSLQNSSFIMCVF
ncbi:FIST C-terminal domain-containing protein [Christensenellaceae bacterium OttesenSCG-928-K19]|nr:FIST C-terminal domain-containing protein [Christensenellaceae bacterium OttesenSCG-928-K19]